MFWNRILCTPLDKPYLFNPFLDQFAGILPDEWLFLFEKIIDYETNVYVPKLGAEEVKLEINLVEGQAYKTYTVAGEDEEENYAIQALNMNHYDILKQTFFSVLLASLRVDSLFEVNPVDKIVKDINSGDYFLYVGTPNENIVTFEDLHRLKSDAETVKFITGAMQTLSFLQSVLDFQHGEFTISSVFWNTQKSEVVLDPSRSCEVSFSDGPEPKSYDAALFFTSIASFYIGLLREEEEDTDAERSDDAFDGGGGLNVGGAVARTCLYIYEEYKIAKKFIEEASDFENDLTEDDLTEEVFTSTALSTFVDTPLDGTDSDAASSVETDSNASTETLVYNLSESPYEAMLDCNLRDEEIYEGKIFSMEAFMNDPFLLNANVPSCSPSKLLDLFLRELGERPTYEGRPFKKQRTNECMRVQPVKSAQQLLKF